MRIVVDARNLEQTSTEASFAYLQMLLQRLIAIRPQDQFLLIAPAGLVPQSAHCSYLPLPQTRTYLGLRRWYNRTLPALLKAQQADVLLSLDALPAASPVPAVAVISTLSAIIRKPPGLFSFRYRNYSLRQLRLARLVATTSQAQQQLLAGMAAIAPEKTTALGYLPLPGYAPAGWQQQEAITGRYTEGKAYFLYTGPFTTTALLLVLKAFSLFKKRQLSSMQLLAAGHFAPDPAFREKLATYKYRQDVQLLPQATGAVLSELVAGAYAVIDLSDGEPAAFRAVAALQCHLPVIGSEKNEALQEVAAGAMLPAGDTPEAVAEQMKLVFKDENLRQQLVLRAQAKAAILVREQPVQHLWQALQYATAENGPTFAAAPGQPAM